MVISPSAAIAFGGAEIRIRAERRLGEMLKETPKQSGARGKSGGGTRGSKKVPQVDAPPTLAEIGIDKKLSASEIRIRAERRLGGMLMERPKAKGKLKRGPVVPEKNHGDTPTLAEIGIDKKCPRPRFVSGPNDGWGECSWKRQRLREAEAS